MTNEADRLRQYRIDAGLTSPEIELREEIARLRAEVERLQDKATCLESDWSNCSRACAKMQDKVAARDRVIEAAFKALDGWEYDHASIAGVRTDEARRLRAELEGK